MTDKASPAFWVSVDQRKLSLSFWPRDVGLHVSVDLTERDARSLAKKLLDAADGLPRVAEASDLGIAP